MVAVDRRSTEIADASAIGILEERVPPRAGPGASTPSRSCTTARSWASQIIPTSRTSSRTRTSASSARWSSAAWAVSEQVKPRAPARDPLASAPAMIAIMKQGRDLDFRERGLRRVLGQAPLFDACSPRSPTKRMRAARRAADEVRVAGDRRRAAPKPLHNHIGSVDRVVVFAIDDGAGQRPPQRARLLELERTARKQRPRAHEGRVPSPPSLTSYARR